MIKLHRPDPPRNPALDPFRNRHWSQAAFYVPKALIRPRAVNNRAFVSVIESHRFAVVAPNQQAADARASIIFS